MILLRYPKFGHNFSLSFHDVWFTNKPFNTHTKSFSTWVLGLIVHLARQVKIPLQLDLPLYHQRFSKATQTRKHSLSRFGDVSTVVGVFGAVNSGKLNQVVPSLSKKKLHCGKLTRQWKINHLDGMCQEKMVIFHCYVRLPEGTARVLTLQIVFFLGGGPWNRISFKSG